MRITQQVGNPPTWQFNEVTEEDRARVTAFVEKWRGTVVNPWEPFLISFGEAGAEAAFRREFGAFIEPE